MQLQMSLYLSRIYSFENNEKYRKATDSIL